MTRDQMIASDNTSARVGAPSAVNKAAKVPPVRAGMWRSLLASPAPWSTVLFGALLASLSAAALRLALLDVPPQFDELYHILAAQGFLETGTFAIGDGVYNRASLYTRLVAAALDLFGDSMLVGRLPALVFGSLLAGVVFAFVARVAGLVAAAFAAFFTVVWPEGIAVSEFVRFYALHGLLFLLAAIAIYRIIGRSTGWLERIILAPATAALLALSAHLQATTLIGLVGLCAWIGLFVVLPAVWSLRWRWAILGVMALGCAAALAVAVQTGVAADAWRMFRSTPLWVAEWRDYERYYFDVLLLQYPLLWPLTPIAVIVGLVVRPRVVLMATTVFGVGFVLHSLGGMKSYRYLYYLMPFLFMIWGIAIATIVAAAASAVARGSHSSNRRRLAGAAASLAVVVAIVVNPAVPLAMRMATSSEPPAPLADMAAAQPALADAVRDADLVLTGSELHGIHYFGRADILVSASRQSEVADGEEFVIDPRTGVPVVATALSVSRLIDCAATGVFMTPEPLWVSGGPLRAAFDEETLKALSPIDVPEDSQVVAFRWSHEPTSGAECTGLPGSGTAGPS